MKLSIDDARQRVIQIMAAAQASQDMVEQQHITYLKYCQDAATTIEEALHSKGYKNMQDMLEDSLKDMPEDKRKEIQKLLDDIKKPDAAWEKFKKWISETPGKAALDSAQLVCDFLTFGYVAKSFKNWNAASWDVDLATTRTLGNITKLSRTEVLSLGTLFKDAEIGIKQMAQYGKWPPEVVETEMKALKELRLSEDPFVQTVTKDYIKAGQEVQLAEQALAKEFNAINETRAALSKARRGLGKSVLTFIVVTAAFYGAEALYEEHQKTQVIAKLEAALLTTATSRVYAKVAEKQCQTILERPSCIKKMAKYWKDGKMDRYEEELKDFLEIAKDAETIKAEDVFNELRVRDEKKDSQGHPIYKTDDDPKDFSIIEKKHNEIVKMG